MTTLAAHALTTLDEACSQCGIEVGDDDDVIIKTINRASKRIASYLRGAGGALHYSASVVEDVAGFGTTDLIVQRTPVWSIASITLDGDAVDDDDYSISEPEAGIIFNPSLWSWTTRRIASAAQPALAGGEEKLYRVTYAGGWWTPAQGPESAAPAITGVLLPEDIEEAALLLVSTMYARRGTGADVQSESLMSYSVTYKDAGTNDAGANGLPAEVAAILAQYKMLQQA